MAKMFYTLEEVCQRLGKTEDEVKEMARSGQLQEFRDRDKLMFKVDQIDLLAGGDDDTGEVHLDLEDSSAGGSGLDLQPDAPLSLEESRTGDESAERTGAGTGAGTDAGGDAGGDASGGSGEESRLGLEESRIGLEESREATGTGISVFDTEHGEEEEDTTERTHQAEEDVIGDEEEELSLESVGSGSGLLDLTRESDDTSLGAELLEEVYSGDDNIEIPGSASGLFEAAGTEPASEQSAEMPAAAVPMVVESYDGAGSGLGVGMMIGAMAALVLVAIIVVVGIFGATPDLAMKMGGSDTTLMIWGGGLLGGTILLGLIGLIIGKATS